MHNRSSIIRMSHYRNAVLRLKAMNFVRVFSDNLADAAGVTAVQVRKDFSIFGITGSRRGGYKVDELIEKFNGILGKDELQKFVIIGVGNLGRALLHYPFEKHGIKIVAGFDIDTGKHNRDSKVPVLPIEDLTEFIEREKIELAVITTPDYAAQKMLDFMIPAGIRGVLNFTPVCLRGPKGVVINNISLVSELENIIYFVNVAENASDEE
ncbi:MAG: redox-sensing transcriptional repressor Rex [Phycisphaerae bacterium]|nr:redox-sensing transcriptional repressor Rex [Phycisphaerae bacterium]